MCYKYRSLTSSPVVTYTPTLLNAMATTINNIEFPEVEEAADTEFTLEHAKAEQETLDSVDMEGEEISCDAVVLAEDSEMANNMNELELEQVPIGVDKVTLLRNGACTEGEALVFTNEEADCEDLPGQGINELDSEDLDGEDDPEFNAEQALVNAEAEEEDTVDSTDEHESVELAGVSAKENLRDGTSKLVFDDVEQARKEHESADACDDDEEAGTAGMLASVNEDYDETE